ncbi:MAG: peptidase [Betaproteobacteria bacterium]|nr:peptidase [Betaproteobacteria bacterium]
MVCKTMTESPLFERGHMRSGWTNPLRPIMVAVSVVFLPLSTLAQQPATESIESTALRFDIERYQVDGNTLLKPEAISRLVAPYTGKQKDFSDVQRALEALEIAYRDLGYGSVQVILPEQNISTGNVLFKVVEPKIGRIEVEGNVYNDAANVLRSLPALREGLIPNANRIARNLLLANENPARQLTVLMRSGQSEEQVDATIKVAEEKPWKASLTLDNTGTTSTGDYRVSAGYQHANMFNRDHVMTFQYITSPNHLSDVKVYGLGYRIPLYELGSSIEIVGGYSNVNSGTVGGLFNVSGSGTVGALRYNHYLPKLGEYEQKLVYGMDYKAFQNQLIAQGQNLSPDITVHPASVSYFGTLRRESSEFGFYVNYTQNVFVGDSDDSDSDFKASRADARAGYRIARYGAHYTRALPNDWQARLQMLGQYTPDALVAGEQFGVGGPDSVRGFLVREVANDRGNQMNAEIYTPNVASKLGWTDAQVRLLAFSDWGWLGRNQAQPGESNQQSIGSVGVGVRVTASQRFVMRADYARVLNAGGAEDKGHNRLNFSLTTNF